MTDLTDKQVLFLAIEGMRPGDSLELQGKTISIQHDSYGFTFCIKKRGQIVYWPLSKKLTVKFWKTLGGVKRAIQRKLV